MSTEQPRKVIDEIITESKFAQITAVLGSSPINCIRLASDSSWLAPILKIHTAPTAISPD